MLYRVVRVDIFLTRMWKALARLHQFTSRGREVGLIKHVIEAPVPSLESERSCIVLGVSILPLSTIFVLHFGTVPTMWDLLFFIEFLISDFW